MCKCQPVRRVALLLLLAAGVASGGCGDGEEAAELRPLAAAAERLEREKTIKFDYFFALPVPGQGEATMRGRAVSDTDGYRSRLNGWMALGGGREFKLDGILIGDVNYLRARALTGTDRWVKLTDRSSPVRHMTMAEFAEMLRSSDDVEDIGAERVGRRNTTHYRATVSTEQMLESSPEEARERLKRLEDVDLDFPIEAWIDRAGFVRRIAMTVEAEGAQLRATVDRLEYGARLRAEPPPGNLVIDGGRVGAG
jgi:hypothetical protein